LQKGEGGWEKSKGKEGNEAGGCGCHRNLEVGLTAEKHCTEQRRGEWERCEWSEPAWGAADPWVVTWNTSRERATWR
jgi:hypothetical protein